MPSNIDFVLRNIKYLDFEYLSPSVTIRLVEDTGKERGAEIAKLVSMNIFLCLTPVTHDVTT